MHDVIDAAVIIQWQYDSFPTRWSTRSAPRWWERYCRKRKTKLMADSYAESLHIFFASFFFLFFSFFFTYWSRYEFLFYRRRTRRFQSPTGRWAKKFFHFPSRGAGTRLTNIGGGGEFAMECERYSSIPRDLASLFQCSGGFFSTLARSIALGLSFRLRRRGWWPARGKGVSSWLGRCGRSTRNLLEWTMRRRSIEDIESCCVKMRENVRNKKRTDRAPND